MTEAPTIEPHGIYTVGQLGALLDVSEATLVKARRSGALRATKKGRRVLFLGESVLEWLRSDGGDVDAPR
jgi:excisionase family DNA binding protein